MPGSHERRNTGRNNVAQSGVRPNRSRSAVRSNTSIPVTPSCGSSDLEIADPTGRSPLSIVHPGCCHSWGGAPPPGWVRRSAMTLQPSLIER